MIYRKYELAKKYNFDEVIDPIIKKHTIDNNNFKKKHVSNGETINIYVYERYFFRINSNLAITIISTEKNDSTTIELISAGGCDGLFLEDLGAEASSIKEVIKILKKDGFVEIK